jgi:hypothetical protein
MTRWVAALLAAAVTIGVAPVARAQSLDPAAATELFRQGRAAMTNGDYAAACPRFAESMRLDAKVGTALNLADCEEHLGQLASAHAQLQRAIDLARAQHDDRLGLAEEHFAALDRRVPRLTITLAAGAPADVTVKRDDVPLGPGSLGTALPVDPGTHRIVVTATGFEARTFPVELTEGQSSQLEVSPGPRIAEAVLPPPASAPSTVSVQTVPPRPETAPAPRASSRTWGWIAGGVGVAGVGVGSVFGLLAISKNAASKQSGGGTCNAANVCDQADKSLRDSARTFGDVSTAAFIVGGVGLATGAILLWLVPGTRASAAVRAYPVVGAGDAGFAVEGRW